jgi:hypothetical protein
MKIEFTLVDDEGKQYYGTADLAADAHHAKSETRVGPDVGPTTKQPQPMGLPDHILALRGEGFFSEPRTPNEVHEKLQKNYRCLFDRVQMALLRLQRRRELRKAVKRDGDRDKVAYVW